MKYIKTFETICIRDAAEKQHYIQEKQEELLDFCRSYLMYLTDIGFRLHVSDRTSANSVIWMKKGWGENQSVFSWEEVKYDYLVFLEVLKSKYDLNLDTCITFISKSNTSHKDFSYDHIMNDEYCVGVNKDKIIAIGVSIKTYSYREKIVDSELYL